MYNSEELQEVDQDLHKNNSYNSYYDYWQEDNYGLNHFDLLHGEGVFNSQSNQNIDQLEENQTFNQQITNQTSGSQPISIQNLINFPELISSDQTQSSNQQIRRTSNNCIKPVFTCLKRIVAQFDYCFSGFFPNFMEKNQNSVKKQYFEYIISFAQFQTIEHKGEQINLLSFLEMYKGKFDTQIQKMAKKGKQEDVQRSSEAKQFADLFYRALKQTDYKKRLKILFKGRKHPDALKKVQQMRTEFESFKLKK